MRLQTDRQTDRLTDSPSTDWIQGHDLGRRFKALVCHDGVFSTQSQWSTEELFFPIHDFGGTLWDKADVYRRWDPSLHTDKWATPQLVIHNELDYRLPIAEGLAAFNVLQARGVPSKLLVFPDENHVSWVYCVCVYVMFMFMFVCSLLTLLSLLAF